MLATCRAHGIIAGIDGCSIFVSKDTFARLAPLLSDEDMVQNAGSPTDRSTSSVAPGQYFWAHCGGRAPVVARLMPSPTKYAELVASCQYKEGESAIPCWLSSAAASSFGLPVSHVHFSDVPSVHRDIVLKPGPAMRMALPIADSAHVTVALLPNADDTSTRCRDGVEEGGMAADSDETGQYKAEAQELALVSGRLVAIARAHLAAQVWSEGMSTRARVGATSLLLAVSTLQPRPGGASPPPAFANAMLFDQTTSLNLSVSAEPAGVAGVAGVPTPTPPPTYTSHPLRDEEEVITKWVRKASKRIGGVTKELTRAALAIHYSLR